MRRFWPKNRLPDSRISPRLKALRRLMGDKGYHECPINPQITFSDIISRTIPYVKPPVNPVPQPESPQQETPGRALAPST